MACPAPRGRVLYGPHLSGLWHALAEDLDLDVTEGGVQRDGHGGRRRRQPASSSQAWSCEVV